MNRVMKIKDIGAKIKKDLASHLKSVAIQGASNIKDELKRRGQDVSVSYSIKSNTIDFVVETKTEKIDTEKLSPKEAGKFKEALGPVPIEMLNEEMTPEISQEAISKAMERTKELLNKKMNETIKRQI